MEQLRLPQNWRVGGPQSGTGLLGDERTIWPVRGLVRTATSSVCSDTTRFCAEQDSKAYRRSRDPNIQYSFRNTERTGMEWRGLGRVTVAGRCEHRDKIPGSIKFGKFLYKLAKYQLLKVDAASWKLPQ